MLTLLYLLAFQDLKLPAEVQAQPGTFVSLIAETKGEIVKFAAIDPGVSLFPAELLAKATMCKQFSDAHTSTFAQATAAQYLKAGRMPATLAKVRAVYAERAQVMTESLTRELGDAVSFVAPQGGLFVWARLTGANGKLADGNVLAKKAIDQGVAFVPGSPFFASNADAATFRLSFATVGTDRIVEGVKRLAAALA